MWQKAYLFAVIVTNPVLIHWYIAFLIETQFSWFLDRNFLSLFKVEAVAGEEWMGKKARQVALYIALWIKSFKAHKSTLAVNGF